MTVSWPPVPPLAGSPLNLPSRYTHTARTRRCDFWIHAECDEISDAGFHFLTAKGDKQVYHCPSCRGEEPGVFGRRLEGKIPEKLKEKAAAVTRRPLQLTPCP